MPRLHIWTSLLFCALTAACASTPSVTVKYYLPRAETAVQAVQTVTCNADQNQVFALTTATPTTTYFADPRRERSFALSSLSHWYADGDTTFTLTEDRRLVTVNSTATGGGEALVKAGVGVITAAAPFFAAPFALEELDKKGGRPPKPLSPAQIACAKIKAAAGDKPLALTYNLKDPITYTTEFGGSFDLVPDDPSAALASDLAPFLPQLKVEIAAKPSAPANAAAYPPGQEAKEDAVLISISDTAPVELKVTATLADQPVKTVAHQTVTVPLPSDLTLPVPRGALFGKRSVSLVIAGSGALTTVGYAATSGAADAATSVSDVLTPLQPKTAGDMAKKYSDEADLIAQQQRLLKCQTSAADCPS